MVEHQLPKLRVAGSNPVSRSSGLFLFPLLVAVVPYLPTLGQGFVYDDLNFIVGNPWLAGWGSLPTVVTSPAWAFLGHGLYYRPLVHVLFLILQGLGGGSAVPFHAVNLLLHGAGAALTFAVARKVAGTDRAGLAAGLLFAVLPVHAEAVSWASGVQDLAASALVLLAFLLAIRERPVASAGAWLAALLFKESAVVLPLWLLAWDAWRKDLRARRYAAHAVAFALYAALRVNALGAFLPSAPPVEGAASGPLASLAAVGFYARLLLWPVGLHAAYPVPPAGFALPGLLALAALGAAAGWAWRKGWPEALGLACFALALLPVLHLSPLGEHPVADRYLYLPSAGLALAAGAAWARLPRARPWTAAGAVVLALLAVLSFSRARVWQDGLPFWEDTVAGNPGSWRAWNNLGQVHARAGRMAEAEEAFRRGAEAWPAAPLPRANRALALIRLGRREEADAAIAAARERAGSDPEAWTTVGIALAERGRRDEAVDAFSRALRLAPDSPRARAQLDRILRP